MTDPSQPPDPEIEQSDHAERLFPDQPPRRIGARRLTQESLLTPKRSRKSSRKASRETAQETETPQATDPSQETSRQVSQETSPALLRPAPTTGWRHWLYRLTRGLINLGPGAAEQRDDQSLVERITAYQGGKLSIAVLSLKGGTGKTSCAAMLGHTLARHQKERVVAVDASPDAGTLGFRVKRETTNSVQDLLPVIKSIDGYDGLRSYTSKATSRLEVLAARTEPDLSSPFNASQYREVAELLSRFYSLVITDCSPGLLHDVMEPVLDLTDQILIVINPTVDGGRSGSLMLDWLAAHGYSKLVAGAIVVLNCLQEKPRVDVEEFEAHFRQRCRAVVRVPYDPHLGQGAETNLDSLQAPTRRAYLELAARVVDRDGDAASGPS
jgi:MinD-like ATPase involved in chromosome partitioning or flagellar assembly